MSTKAAKLKQQYRKTEQIAIDKINPNTWNPNFVATDILEAIKDDMVKNGFIEPIVLQKHNKQLKKDNVIINGEHRWQTWKELGHKEIPSIILDIDDRTAKALTIRLNREHGELLPNGIAAVLNQISEQRDISLLQELTYLKEKDIELLVNMRTSDMTDILDEDKRIQNRLEQKSFKTKAVKCPNCDHEFVIK